MIQKPLVGISDKTAAVTPDAADRNRQSRRA
jgi:hypothetical protein